MKAGVAIVYDRIFLEHVAGEFHPERPERLEACVAALKESGIWEAAAHVDSREATSEELLACHTAGHLDRVQHACYLGRPLDPDTGTCRESWDAALLAAGAGPAASDAIMKGDVLRAFCAVRPPGHHATPDRSMGFCLFNNIAVTARYILKRHGLARLAIVDFDAHHGNGTQEIFYEDGSVLYASTHQSPLFPHTGDGEDTGRGAGEGTTVNCPLEAGAGIDAFREAFEERILPAIERFKPQFLLISAGFDSHVDDPLTDLGLTSGDFGTLTEVLVESSVRHCQGRVISLLEGGYNLEALSESVVSHVSALAD